MGEGSFGAICDWETRATPSVDKVSAGERVYSNTGHERMVSSAVTFGLGHRDISGHKRTAASSSNTFFDLQ